MIALATLANAQIVQSGFEDWTGSLPNGWYGAKSNLPQSGVAQVTDNVHGGTYAVRLTNTEASHKRFTTQPVTVATGQVFEVNFWLRGGGQVRTGIYDNRSEGFGYYYNSYVTATASWTQVTQTVVAVNNASDAEFIFSVLSTSGENIVIDDVTITETAALTVMPIHDIQFTSAPDGASPYVDQIVRFGGIVTAVDLLDNNDQPQLVYWVQDASGPWNGIYVKDFPDAGHDVVIGDQVEMIAKVTEYFGLTEIYGADIQSFTLVASGQTVPAPLAIQSGELSNEALESVLVRLNSASCTDVPSGANFGNWSADDGSGAALIGHQIWVTAPTPILGQAYNVTGVVSFGFDEYHIEPRMTADVETANGIAEAGVLATVTVGPNPAADMLTIALGQAAGRRVEYTLTDATGRALRTGVITSDRTTLGLEGLANGNYHLTLRNAELLKSIAVQVAQ